MNNTARLCIVIVSAVCAATQWCGRFSYADELKFSSVKRMAEANIERIKAAKERAEERLLLSADRSVDQLNRSEEDLIRRVEMLERVREQIQDQMAEISLASSPVIADATQELCATLSELQSQIQAARALVKELETKRLEAEARATKAGKRSGSGPALWDTPCGSGAKSPDADACNLSNGVPPPPPVVNPPLPRPKPG